MNELLNISPIDGRYHETTKILNNYFSEYALIKYRTIVEIKWLIFLSEEEIISEKLSKKEKEKLLNIIDNFSLDDAIRVKEIEKTTNHDVKAIEYFLREKLTNLSLNRLLSFIHITLTSEDINNVAYNLMLQKTLNDVYLPEINNLINLLNALSLKYQHIPMLSHTHGQNATPTTVGKELKIFAYRLNNLVNFILNLTLTCKFSGSVGNYNCHVVAYPDVDWIKETKKFIENFDFKYNPLTTQIESHDTLCVLLSYLKISNNIVKDFNSDMWLYISRNYFHEKVNSKEVGSSVMPHKVNPINHENSMANIEIANSLIDALINNLSISRMQRDLTDSSKLRNLGVIFSHILISLKQSMIGLNKMEVNQEYLKEELNNNYNVLTEAIQTVLRKNHKVDAYEQLKELTRGKNITKEELHDFINNLDIDNNDKKRLLALTPETYLGLAELIIENN